MMSAENDPLGPLPPGWGKLAFAAGLQHTCGPSVSVSVLCSCSQSAVSTPTIASTLSITTQRRRSGKTREHKGE